MSSIQVIGYKVDGEGGLEALLVREAGRDQVVEYRAGETDPVAITSLNPQEGNREKVLTLGGYSVPPQPLNVPSLRQDDAYAAITAGMQAHFPTR